MSDQFIAEIRIVGFNFPPSGWAFCDGQQLPIGQNATLYSLIGSTYGGDGQSYFALPNLQGSAPLQQGQRPFAGLYNLGQSGGAQTVELTEDEIPPHTHHALASAGGDQSTPVGNTWSTLGASRTPPPLYSDTQNTQMGSQAVATTGNGAAHNNMHPYLTMVYIIALQGVLPVRS